jgi:hypothetical protein
VHSPAHTPDLFPPPLEAVAKTWVARTLDALYSPYVREQLRLHERTAEWKVELVYEQEPTTEKQSALADEHEEEAREKILYLVLLRRGPSHTLHLCEGFIFELVYV